MRKDKAWSLDKALLYSYQAETAILADGREFRCLINPNKLSMELDDKMLSIPFADVCLNSNSKQKVDIGVKPGDCLEWKENGTHWLVYSHYLQEDAYFRGLMRQCDTFVEINGVKYWVYIKGPSEKTINWQKTSSFNFNNLNYTLELYISNTPETNEFFQRFTKLKVLGKSWEVQAVDRITTEGILGVYLKEDYDNEFEEESSIENSNSADNNSSLIIGPQQVQPLGVYCYSTVDMDNGVWKLSNSKARIITQSNRKVEIEIVSMKSGQVNLIYKTNSREIIYPIIISSL